MRFGATNLPLALFERLPADLAKQAIDEFVGLLNTRQLTWELAGVFEGAPTAAQNRIVEQLDTADDRSRRWFAKALHDKGLDVAIPGIEKPSCQTLGICLAASVQSVAVSLEGQAVALGFLPTADTSAIGVTRGLCAVTHCVAAKSVGGGL